MLKPFSKYAHVALAFALILPLASGPVDAKPSSSSSFKSGFSSQRSSSSSSSSSSKSFSSPKPSKSSSGGFGSFNSSRSPDARKPDSALSRKLDRERSDANALRTLDERRAAQAARESRAARAPQQGNGYGYGYGNAPPAQPPIIVNNNNGGSGLGHIVAGAILARQAANAHANGNYAGNGNGGYYPAPDGATGDLASQAGANSVGTGGNGAAAGSTVPALAPAAKDGGGTLFGTFAWLCVLSLIGWCIYFAWKRAKARRAAGKPNYSFERN